MLSEYAKRIVASLRREAGYRAMYNKGDITNEECEALCAEERRKVAAWRAEQKAQGQLELVPPKPAVAPSGAESGQDSKEGGKPVPKGR